MITLTAYNNTKRIYVEPANILRVVDGHDLVGNRSYPWSDITVQDPFDGHQKIIRVVESAKYIGKLMSEDIRKNAANKNKGEK